MRFTVLGGGGFIGSHLTEALIRQQKIVSVFDQCGASHLKVLENAGAKIKIGNFLSEKDIKIAVSGTDILFHLISTTVPANSNLNISYDIQSNLISTINLLMAAKDSGVKKIVFASSGGTVYGVPNSIPISEQHPTNPISSYGIIKLAIEKYLHLFYKLYSLDYCILRISNAYGERQTHLSHQGLIPTIIFNALNKEEIIIWGDGTVVRDYIHVNDIVKALLCASSYTGDEKIFNIGSGLGHSVNEVISIIEQLLNQKIEVCYKPSRSFDVPVNILDNCLAKSQLEWEPKIVLSTGIKRVINYIQHVVQHETT